MGHTHELKRQRLKRIEADVSLKYLDRSCVLDASGRYTEVMAARGRPKFTAGRNSPADEFKAATQGMLTNFGTWSVSETDKTVTFHVEGCAVPEF
jgi:hypothetical protein